MKNKINVKFVIFGAKCVLKEQSKAIGTTGVCPFGFVHSMYNHFIFPTGQKNIVIFSLANLYVVR